MNKSKLLSSTVAATILVASSIAVAHEGEHKANPGYVGDMQGHIELDGSGNCLHTSIFDKAKHGLAECGEGPEKVAKPAPAPAPAPAPKPVVYETITIGANALFDTNKSDLRAAGRAELDTVASKLNSFYSLEGIDVTGHTDSTGAADYNQGLSERRAAQVKSYLVSKGVPANKISTSGAGENSPVASNGTSAGRQQNRRVDILIRAKK